MLKTRIIGVVLVKNNIAVQSLQFKHYLPIGKPEIAIRYLDQWGVDEIVVLHLDGAHSNYPFKPEQVRSYAKQCHVPLAIGGGIRDINAIKKTIHAGADKIILNNIAYTQPTLISQCSDLFGQQCVVISIDAKQVENGLRTAHFYAGNMNSNITAANLAKKVQDLGAGEIFLTSIERDGSKQGYDITLIKSVTCSVNIPVIACGGAGHPRHAYEAILEGVSAIAVGNHFHFIEHSVILFKKYLISLKAFIRADSYILYQNNPTDQTGRLAKHNDEILDNLRFQYIPEETI